MLRTRRHRLCKAQLLWSPRGGGSVICSSSSLRPWTPRLAMPRAAGPRWPSLALALSQSHRHSAEPTAISRCLLRPGRPCMASLPIGCHLQAEAGLHVHELLIVPQPVGHGQGEGRLLILQAGNRALKGTDSYEIGGRELRWVEPKVPTVQDTKGNEKPPAL